MQTSSDDEEDDEEDDDDFYDTGGFRLQNRSVLAQRAMEREPTVAKQPNSAKVSACLFLLYLVISNHPRCHFSHCKSVIHVSSITPH